MVASINADPTLPTELWKCVGSVECRLAWSICIGSKDRQSDKFLVKESFNPALVLSNRFFDPITKGFWPALLFNPQISVGTEPLHPDFGRVVGRFFWRLLG